MKSNEINIRDPYILPYDGKYYLYGTRSETAFVGQAYGFDVYVSNDLENWEGPFEVFHRPEGFWSEKSYWAPEVYFYQDKFYMFATFADKHKGLGTAVLVAENPKGPFTLWSDGYVTPKDWASEAKPFVKRYFFRNYITDGPFLIRTEDEKLHMLWSTNAKTGYVEAMAYSDNNEINGNWKIDSQPLYDYDGGHGMIFKSFSDQYYLVLHYPNKFGKEHPSFMPLKYEDGKFQFDKNTIR